MGGKPKAPKNEQISQETVNLSRQQFSRLLNRYNREAKRQRNLLNQQLSVSTAANQEQRQFAIDQQNLLRQQGQAQQALINQQLSLANQAQEQGQQETALQSQYAQSQRNRATNLLNKQMSQTLEERGNILSLLERRRRRFTQTI